MIFSGLRLQVYKRMRIVDFYHFSTNQWRRQGGGGAPGAGAPPKMSRKFFLVAAGFPHIPIWHYCLNCTKFGQLMYSPTTSKTLLNFKVILKGQGHMGFLCLLCA